MTIVIDLGSYQTRAGFALDMAPQFLESSCAITHSASRESFFNLYGESAVLDTSVVVNKTNATFSTNSFIDDAYSLVNANEKAQYSKVTTPLWSVANLYQDGHLSGGGDNALSSAELLYGHLMHLYRQLGLLGGNFDNNRRSLGMPNYRKRTATGGVLTNIDESETSLLSSDHPLNIVAPELWFEKTDYLRKCCSIILESAYGLYNRNNTTDFQNDSSPSCGSGCTYESKIPGLYLSRPSVCSVIGSGKASGLVLNVGHTQCTAAAVTDGHVLRKTVKIAAGVGGATVIECMSDALAKKMIETKNGDYVCAKDLIQESVIGRCFGEEGATQDGGLLSSSSTASFSAHTPTVEVREYAFKRALNNFKIYSGACFVHISQISEAEEMRYIKDKVTRAERTPFVAPDGTPIFLGKEVVSDPFECLFVNNENISSLRDSLGGAAQQQQCRNHLNGTTGASVEAGAFCNVTDLLVEAKASTPVEIGANLPLILCGGSVLATGFTSRLLHELKMRDHSAATTSFLKNVSAFSSPTALPLLPWQGAAMLSCSAAFAPLWITPAEFAEEGLQVIKRKLFL